MSAHPCCSVVRCSVVRSSRCAFLAIYIFSGLCLFESLSLAEEPTLPLNIAKLDRTTPVDFGKEVMPILKRNCLACHHKTDAEGGLVLESLPAILKGGDNGPAVIAKDAAASLLISRATGQVEPLMPPSDNTVGAVPLTADELGLLQLWIKQGAIGSNDEHESIRWQPIAESMRAVYALDVSPDGQRLAFGRGNRVLVADIEHPTELLPLVDETLNLGPVADRDLIQSIAFSPDRTRIATGGFRTVRLWKRVGAEPIDAESQRFKFASGRTVQHFAMDDSHSAVAMINAIGDVELWDLASNARRAIIGGQRDEIVGLAWAGSTGRLMVASVSGVVTAYDGNSGSEIAKLDLEASLECLSVCNDGVHLSVIDQEHRVQLLRLVAATGETPTSITVVNKAIADVADATSIVFISKPNLLTAIASASRGVLCVDPMTNQVARTLEASAGFKAMVVSRDETKLVAGSLDGTAKIWNVTDGKLLTSCQGTSVAQLNLSKATRDAARQKSLVDRLTSKTTELQDLLKKEDESLAMIIKARDEAMAASQVNEAEAEKAKTDAELVKQQRAVEAATIAQKRAADAIPAHQSKLQAETRRLARLDQKLTHTREQLVAPGNAIVGLAVNAEATRVATIHRDGLAAVYRTGDGQAVATFPSRRTSGLTEQVQATMPQVMMIGNTICRLEASGTLDCLSLSEHWELERTMGASDDAKTLVDRVTALDFRPDGMTLAVGTGEASRSGVVKLFAVQTGEVVRDLGELHNDTVLGLDFSPDGQTLASSAADRVIRLIDVASGTVTRTLEGHTHHVLSIAWQDNGRTLASAGADQSIKIWDVETGETSRTINGFSQELTSIKFVEATDQVVAACGSGQVRLANATTGATVRTLDAAKDFLFAVALTPDGKRLFAGGQSGIVRIWNITDGTVVAELTP